MNIELRKWIIANTDYLTYVVMTSIIGNNTGYSNLIEFVRNFADSLNSNYILLKISTINAFEINSLPPKILCFKVINQNIVDKSIKYINDPHRIFEYDYMILFDNNGRKIKISLNHFLLFIIINKFYLLILFFMSFMFFIENFYNNYYSIFIIFQITNLIILFQLSQEKENSYIKKICSIGLNNQDRCSKLKKITPKVAGLLDFSELGVIYFLSLLICEVCYLNFNYSRLENILIIFYSLGGSMMIYSTFIQLSKRIFCPICIFTVFVLLIQFISIYFLFNSVDYFSIFDLLCVLATLLFFLILITEQKITNKFKRGYFEANFDFKELLQNNLKPIVSNLKDGSNMIGELLKFGIHSGQTERKEKLILCMNIRCNSCIKLITELKVLSYSHYDIRVLFHITEKEGEISKNHDFKSNILLALILEKHGFLRFSEILNESIQRDLDYKYIKKKSLEKNVVLSQNSLDNMGQKIIKQNKILNKFNVKEIPFIILNNKVIPPYFKSIHYDLLR